jgi:hypothetical protein
MSWLRLIEENMKEKKATPAEAGEAAEGAASPGLHKRNRFSHLVGEMWPAYLIEIVVIILGISITLALETWRDEAKEERTEKIYLSNLAADLQVDLNSLQRAADSTKVLLKNGEDLLQAIRSPLNHPLSGAQLTLDLRSILGRPKFISHDATFSELKSSGNLHLIKNVDLKWLLFDYYGQAQIIKENQDAEQQATITLVGPYFLKRFPLDGLDTAATTAKANDLMQLAGDIEFRNDVLLRVANRQELSALYRKADSLATELKAGLQHN